MSVCILASPIGNPLDLSFRALKLIKESSFIICESQKQTASLLASHGLRAKKYELLNEHTSEEDIKKLVDLCKKKKVVLMSDAGTPNFCDPGRKFIFLLRQNKIPYFCAPGPCSLSAFLSLIDFPYSSFVFYGFLSQKTEIREKQIQAIKKEKKPCILMDTPYRMKKLLKALSQHMPQRKACLALSLSMDQEKLIYKNLKSLSDEDIPKQNFILYLHSLNP